MVSWEVYLAALGISLVGGALLTLSVKRIALSKGMLDVPNHRSAHVRPIPRGGGAAVAIVGTIALVFSASLEQRLQLAWLALGALPIAAVSLIDDRVGLSAKVRLIVHFAGSIIFITGTRLSAGFLPFDFAIFSGLLLQAAIVLALVWHTNLFNFMDGIDGLAGTQAFFVAGSFCLFAPQTAVGLASLCLAGAAIGFLFFNWTPARIFMGDVGSAYLGFVLAGLGIILVIDGLISVWTAAILTSSFWIDATFTLIVRAIRGECLSQPHSQHAYQHAARRMKSHSKVSLAVLAVDLFWLLPLAWLAKLRSEAAPLVAAAAVVPLAFLVWRMGSGRPNESFAGSSALS